MAFNIEMLRYFANKMWRKNKDTFVSKETGKSLSTNDYTNEDKNKLDNLSAESTTYSNTTSGLSATNVQGAIDEINTELSDKSDSTHNHDSVYYTKSNVYTKTEIDTKLSTKSDSSHTHDGRYYTETEIDTKLSGKSDTSHNHNDIYYTKTEIDNMMSGHNDSKIFSENGVHGIRYFNNKLEVYNTDTNTWEEVSGGLSLEDDSWDKINAIAQAGLASVAYSIGDTKSISIDGTNYNIQIYDFNHDDLADGSGKAKITFGLANCLSKNYRMSGNNTTSGGWSSCELRTTLQNTILNQLPTELKSLIKTVKKKTSAGNTSSNINTRSDTLFLCSEVEVFGYNSVSAAGEGTQYPIFTNNNSRIKKKGDTGSDCGWWERSPHASISTYFCSVFAVGSAGNYGASSTHGVCFGFCI